MFTGSVQPRALNCTVALTTVSALMRATRIRLTVVVGVLLVTAPAWTRPREPAHPGDETEVFTGGEETAQGAVPRRPALAHWKLRPTLRGPAPERPPPAGGLGPPSPGRPDVLRRRAVG